MPGGRICGRTIGRATTRTWVGAWCSSYMRRVRNRGAILRCFLAACAGKEKFAGLVGIMSGARGAVLKYGLYDPTYYDAALESIREWGKRPDAAFWYGICWAEGVRCTGTD